ncbi:hypothetical protein [Pseudomonas zhanjiangensis]|uniref:DUF4386 domain-containing protein n=1 Tax=Pseudomonas zhanjiangensis TaxID=3239015 RepID=A0ABV3YZD1_9PSED
MEGAPKIEGSKLVILRMAGVAMIIACVNYAYIGYITGIIEVGTRRHSLLMAGENLWLGYLFLLSSAAISTFLLFINKSQAKEFNALAKTFGSAWFVILGACILTNMSAR